jgi:hypothetical protein
VSQALTAAVRSDELRRGALAGVVGAVMFGVLARLLAVGDGMGVVAERYDSLFMPARYAFSIWLAIAGAFAWYAVATRRRSQRAVGGHDAQAKLIIAASVLVPMWMVAFRFDLMSIALLFKIAMLVVAIAMFLDAHDLCRRERARAVWAVPFALFLGWVGVTTLVDLGVWMVAIGWRGGGVGETTIAVGMIAVAAVVGIAVGVRFADAVVPLVVSWALLGVWVARRDADLAVAMSAVAATAACVVGAGIAWVRGALRARQDHAPRRIGHGDGHAHGVAAAG